jgi:hypothetical protein
MKRDKALALLGQVLSSPNDLKLLATLEKQSEEILHALQEADESEADLTELGQEMDAEWLAKVYEALAGPEMANPEELEAARRLVEANEASERNIGIAFRDVLLPGLPHAEFAEAFEGCAPAPELMKTMKEDPSVQGAGDAGWPLAVFGVSPYMVLQAAKATAALVQRMERQKNIKGEAVLEPVPGSLSAKSLIECAVVHRQIHRSSGALLHVVPHLHHWMVRIAAHRPFFYPKFVSEITGEGVTLRPKRHKMPLKDLWSARH